jgi:hypothetical protein
MPPNSGQEVTQVVLNSVKSKNEKQFTMGDN